MSEQTPATLAAPLAVEMTIITGELWRVRTETESTFLQIFSPSAYLSMWTGYNIRGRVQIKASEPQKMKSPRRGESITCALDRTPEAIARDICARLLPAARAHLEISKAYDLRERKEKNAKNLRENFIKKYLPDEYHNYHSERQFHRRGDSKTLRAQLTYENKVEIKLNLDFIKALQLLKHLEENY